jgi:hypothetical protein
LTHIRIILSGFFLCKLSMRTTEAATIILIIFVFGSGMAAAEARPVAVERRVVVRSWAKTESSAQPSGCTNGSGVGGGYCHPPAGH